MADIQTITVGGTQYNIKDAGAARSSHGTHVPATTTAGLVLKSTATSGTVTWAAPCVYIGTTESAPTGTLLCVDPSTGILKYKNGSNWYNVVSVWG